MSLAGTQHDTADAVVSDLGPLAWVFDELRKSLESASKALKRFALETRQARESDLGVADPAPLRVARTQLHQATGALDMVGLGAPAMVVKAMEAAVQRFLSKPNTCTDDAIDKLERAGFALVEYLESALNNKPIQPVSLFPNYRDVQELAGAQRIHPADLWDMPQRRHPLRWPSGVQLKPLPPGPEVRAHFDQNLLHVIRSQNPNAAGQLKSVAAGLAAHFKTHPEAGQFWAVVAAYFEGVEQNLLPNDVYVKRAASRVLLQYSSIAQGKSDISQELLRDLLFLLSQARMPASATALWVQTIRTAWGLDLSKPVDYENASLGRFDPQVLVQARKRISTARESWSLLSGGDVSKQKQVMDHFSLVGDSLQKVFPHGLALAKSLMHAVDVSKLANGLPPPELGVEVATAILYLEAVLQELDLGDPHLEERLSKLAQRVSHAHAGAHSAPLEHWMEELYRRVSDRNTMGSVVGELKVSLGELERSLDQFFRDPKQKTPLMAVPQQLAQMRGVLSVLGLQHATQAVLRMRDKVEELLVDQIDEVKAKQTGSFGHLANNLSALSFLIDMLNYQPALARKLFVFDAETGELKPLMGRTVDPDAQLPADSGTHGIDGLDVAFLDDEPVVDLSTDLVLDMAEEAPAATTVAAPASVAAVALPELSIGVAPGVVASTAVVVRAAPAAVASALPPLSPQPSPSPSPSPVTPYPVVSAPVQVAADAVDPELLDIFLEEAKEVIEAGSGAIATLERSPSSQDDLTTLRRAFHTLKGSSRMVGLNDFGESAWSMEQLLNAWLAEAKPAHPDLCRLAQSALNEMGLWIGCISEHAPSRWTPEGFRRSADALRLQGQVVPLSFVETTPPVPVSPASPAPSITVVVQPTQVSSAPASAPSVPSVPSAPMASPNFDDLGLFAEEVRPGFEATTFDDPFAPPEAVPEAVVMPLLDDIAELFPADPLVPNEATSGLVTDELSDLDFDSFFANEAAGSLPLESPPLQETAPVASDKHPPQATASFMTEDVDIARVDEVAQPEIIVDWGIQWEPATPPVVDKLPLPTELPVVRAALDEKTPSSLDALSSVAGAPSHEPFVHTPDQPVPVPAMDADDGTKQIGALRISVRLFNVFLGEADEWSRRLSDELSAWAQTPSMPLPWSPVKLAHSIAGSSGAVGFTALSQLARALEHALDAARVNEGSGILHLPVDAHLFADTAHEIRRLLHQFAAGFLKDPPTHWMGALNAYVHRPLPSLDSEVSTLDEVPTFLEDTDLLWEEPGRAPQEAAIGAAAADMAAAVVPSFEPEEPPPPAAAPLVAAPVALSSTHAPERIEPSKIESSGGTTTPQSAVQDIDDDIDVTDTLDADLFQIFEEEGLELIPRLSESLRRWVTQPVNSGARMETLRALHTLKGSARLTGALRLGEMAHRLESQAESFGSELEPTTDLEPLLTAFDAIAARFEALRQPETAVVPNRTQARVEDAMDVVPLAVSVYEDTTTERVVPVALNSDSNSTVALAPAAPNPLGVAPKTLRVSAAKANAATASIRVRSDLLDRLVNQTGEVMITRSRMDAEVTQLRSSLKDLSDNLDRLRSQLRDIELQAEGQMQSRLAQAKEQDATFDPLEFDRFTRVQELTRMMAESVNDIATVQRNLVRSVESTEDGLIAQTRQTRELQRDLLRTRMVEFEGISERLYRVVRQAAKDSGKQVRLDIEGGRIEMDRSVLDRMTPAFEHLLRNCVGHGIEPPEVRQRAGKPPEGQITVRLGQEGNDVSVVFEDDGAGLNLAKIRAKAVERGLIAPHHPLSNEEAGQLIFAAGLSTAAEVTGLSGRGIGMDVVRSEVVALGGRIETSTQPGLGTQFRMVLPLTTAVTQVVMLRAGEFSFGVPSGLVEVVRRVSPKELAQAYDRQSLTVAGEEVPFYWSGALLQTSRQTEATPGRTLPVVVFRSAAQRVAMHIDEVLGNQEVVVKNLGPQLSRLPGLAGITVLASGAAALIYNPVALSKVYGKEVQAWLGVGQPPVAPVVPGSAVAVAAPLERVLGRMEAKPDAVPLVLVVDDSITVRRVTQRLLQREGYRVSLAADGLQALERLQEELPSVVLSDIEMPRMDGFDLVRNIRADQRWVNLPVIMITSRIAEKHREHARDLGVDHYLGKPYSEEILLGLIGQFCGRDVVALTS